MTHDPQQDKILRRANTAAKWHGRLSALQLFLLIGLPVLAFLCCAGYLYSR